jgi:hypothetical protein
MRFVQDRDRYGFKLRQAVLRYDLSLLDYCLTAGFLTGFGQVFHRILTVYVAKQN